MLEEIAVALGADQGQALLAAKQVVDLEIELANVRIGSIRAINCSFIYTSTNNCTFYIENPML
ncbi:hypothetical protein DPMN_016327 [Dreissena polymorpha]|uniref:Uncharacterized protein n=1 Tax=Dreissena polymorpha TaxID=45954 RepID=A0A9D4S6G4_DREPO|nr:hypothetical protein DPMN_016327 [Dreissena polymorpha]